MEVSTTICTISEFYEIDVNDMKLLFPLRKLGVLITDDKLSDLFMLLFDDNYLTKNRLIIWFLVFKYHAKEYTFVKLFYVDYYILSYINRVHAYIETEI